MGLVGKTVSSVTPSLAEIDGDGETSGTGGDMDGRSTSKVEAAKYEHPAVGVPSPVGNRVIDNRRPNEDKDHQWAESAALSNGTDSENGAGGERSCE